MYELGEGSPKNVAKAVWWFRKAAEQGNPKAKEKLDAIE
jgi:TPR repeat protein